MRTRLKVAYFLRAFPRLSETFILGEILGLRRLGAEVRIVALERIEEARRHPEAEALLPEVLFVPASLRQEAGATNGSRLAGHPPKVSPSPSLPAVRRLAARPHLNGSARPGNGASILGKHECHWQAGEWAAKALVGSGVAHLHAHFAGPAATMAAAAANASGLPFSFTAHAKDIFASSVDWRWIDVVARRASALVTVCDYNRRLLAKRLPGARIERIYNGVDLEWWRPRGSRGRGRARPSHIVAVGRLVHKKGFHVLIDAMGLLKARGIEARLTIVGDGVERERLAQQVRSLGLVSRVRFAGGLTQPEVRRILHRATVMALACVVAPDGNQDALPTALLEAGACAIPAVATGVAGIPEILRHGRTGLVVPPGDAPALARALERLITRPAERDRLGRAARLWIEKRFDQKRSVTALARLFASLSGEHGRALERQDARRPALS